MITINSRGHTRYLVLMLFQGLIHSAAAYEKERFIYDYLDKDNNILKLGCHGDCSTDHHLASIIIYNVKTLDKMAVVNTAKAPTALKSPQKEMSYYVAGSLEKDSCHLELVITNVKPLTHLKVACNLTRFDETGTAITISLQLSINKTESKITSSKTWGPLMYYLVSVSVLALLLVAALGCTIRKCLVYKRRVQTETSHYYSYPTAAELRDQDGGTGHLSLTRFMTSQHPGYLEPVSVIYNPSRESLETHF